MPARRSLEERFWEKVSCDLSTGCVLFNGGRSSGGRYGKVALGGRFGGSEYAHRVSYFLNHGEWPPKRVDGDHHCPNRHCVREHPDHVVFLSNVDHGRRHDRPGRPRRTHCLKGHELTDDNIYLTKRSDRAYLKRMCLTCLRVVWKRSNDKRARKATKTEVH